MSKSCLNPTDPNVVSLVEASRSNFSEFTDSQIRAVAGVYNDKYDSLPSAEQFESWVFDEVLPSIRKTGSYTVPQVKPADVSKAQLSEAKLLNARSRASSMWFKFSNMLDNPEHKQLCAAYGTQVLTGGKMVLPTTSPPTL